MDALQLLLGRRSSKALGAPGPGAEALELILQAALRAPDFLALRPYEFLVAEGEGRERLGRLFQEAAIAEDQARALDAAARACGHHRGRQGARE